MTNVDVVRLCLESYIAQDRATAERLIAPDYTFTSPQDDRIDRAAFFERCFPTADRFRTQRILDAVPACGDGVLIVYEYELVTGERYRNVELSTVRQGKITDTQVFFGGRVAHE
ncbi:nuclear transport factor 2 family protein [Streptacidiphilus sp. PB12-B1b]|uniref:nuclear transport factor 2 family protein n=1 Tax=Streptacidiphilus sp. PB12-B1b TaxID=2705012 RepID=UPI0015F87F79|nr:nuclear transport factor 2 family protein [Streptacidiphilus sp. PB12-B1b]QMU77217.1 nuclear transport factor 2 family protein [Streptacidiphilus sp. PB12-B1b]